VLVVTAHCAVPSPDEPSPDEPSPDEPSLHLATTDMLLLLVGDSHCLLAALVPKTTADVFYKHCCHG